MNISITTAVDEFVRGGDEVLIQNLGPGMLYVGLKSDVSSSTGVQLDVFDAIELPGATDGSLYMTSDSSADVRVVGGIGIAAGSPSAPPAAGSVTTILGGNTSFELSSGAFNLSDFAQGLVLSSAPAAGVTATVTASSTDTDVAFFSNPVTTTFTTGVDSAPLAVGGSYSGSASSFTVDLAVVLASADTDFDGVTASASLTVTVPVVEFQGTAGLLIEDGSAVDLTWQVNSAPTSDVTITFSSTNPNVTFTDGTILSGTTGFTTAGTVQIADDGVDNAGDTIPITATTSSVDLDYDGLSLNFNAVDNPVAVAEVFPGTFQPATVSTFGLSGAPATLDIALGFTPTADVVLAFTSDNADFSVTQGASLTFTTGNFATAQTVEVTYTGAETFDSAIITATVDASSTDTSRVGDVDTIDAFFS